MAILDGQKSFSFSFLAIFVKILTAAFLQIDSR